MFTRKSGVNHQITIGKSLNAVACSKYVFTYFGAFLYIQNATAEKMILGVQAANKG